MEASRRPQSRSILRTRSSASCCSGLAATCRLLTASREHPTSPLRGRVPWRSTRTCRTTSPWTTTIRRGSSVLRWRPVRTAVSASTSGWESARSPAKGLRRWLAGFGVENFTTQEPSDLEYDPQLVVVAEWRDPQTLFKDHIDNAVTDAMLEGAEAGDNIEYSALLLPFARIAKGYSFVLNGLERTGPVPEGMSAPAALRNRSYTRRHQALARTVSWTRNSVCRRQWIPRSLLEARRICARSSLVVYRLTLGPGNTLV